MTDDSTPGTDGSSANTRAVSQSSATVSPVIGDLPPAIVAVLLMIGDLLPMIADLLAMIGDLLPMIGTVSPMIADLLPMIDEVSRYRSAKRANTPENGRLFRKCSMQAMRRWCFDFATRRAGDRRRIAALSGMDIFSDLTKLRA